MPTVSIIIPVYNVSSYLTECLNSIKNQTFKDWEAIIIDDGSTDSSAIICDEYSKTDKRFRVIHQKNEGAAKAKNVGLNTVTGKYTAFVDSDDTVSPIWLEVALQNIGNSEVIEFGFNHHYTTGYKKPVYFSPATISAENYLNQYLDHWHCALFWNKIFLSSVLKNVRFHQERRCIDDEFFTYKAISFSHSIVRISDVLYHYRQRRSGVMRNNSTLYQRTVDNIDILSERYRWIKTHFPKIAKYYLRHDVDTLLYLAQTQIFDSKSIFAFRKTSRFYFIECLIHYPGKTTFYYSLKTLLYKKTNFNYTSKPTNTNTEYLDIFD